MAHPIPPPALRRTISNLSVDASVSEPLAVELRPVQRSSVRAEWINGKLTLITVHNAQGKRLVYDNAAWEDIASKVSEAAKPLFTQNAKAKEISLDLKNFAITQGYLEKPSTLRKYAGKIPTVTEAKNTWKTIGVSEASHRAVFAKLKTVETAINSHDYLLDLEGGYQKPPKQAPLKEADQFIDLEKEVPVTAINKYISAYCPQVCTKTRENFNFKGIDKTKDFAIVLEDKTVDRHLLFYKAKTNTLSIYHPNGKQLVGKTLKALKGFKKSLLSKKAKVEIVQSGSNVAAHHQSAYLADFVRHKYQSEAPYKTSDVDISAARQSMGSFLYAQQ